MKEYIFPYGIDDETVDWLLENVGQQDIDWICREEDDFGGDSVGGFYFTFITKLTIYDDAKAMFFFLRWCG